MSLSMNRDMPGIIVKRLKREKPSLIEKYHNHEIDIVRYDCPSTLNTKKYSVGVKIKIDNTLLEIKLSDTYPFHPPKFFINDVNYRDMLQIGIPYVQKSLNKKGIDCLCCKSILCANFWNPTKKIIDVINEYETNKKIITRIIKHHYTELVCHSKNIYDTLIINKINYFI